MPIRLIGRWKRCAIGATVNRPAPISPNAGQADDQRSRRDDRDDNTDDDQKPRRRWPLIILGIVVVVAVIAAIIYWLMTRARRAPTGLYNALGGGWQEDAADINAPAVATAPPAFDHDAGERPRPVYPAMVYPPAIVPASHRSSIS